MTKEESKQILMILKANYPHSFKGWNEDQATYFTLLWAEAFKNAKLQEVVQAVKNVIYTDTREFPPNIAQIKEEMFKKYESVQADKSQSWETVLRSAKCDYQRARENFDKLPPNIKQAVGSPSFLVELGYSNSNEVVFKRKEFEQNLEKVLTREKEQVLCGELTMKQLEYKNGTKYLGTKQQALLD